MRIGYYFAALGMATLLLACNKSSSPAQEDLYKGWVEHTPVPSDPAISQPTVTYAASPELEIPTDIFGKKNDCNLADMRHAFILDKNEFLLGKRIKVEYRAWLEGPGTWYEPVGTGGCAFRFLARHEDGTWCVTRNVMYGRGLSLSHLVTTENPYSTTRFVGRDSIIEKPGHYDIFCFHALNKTDYPKDRMGRSPIMKRMPEEIHAFRVEFYRKYLNDKEPFDTIKTDKASLDICKTEEDFEQYITMRGTIFHIECADVFAHFQIVVCDKVNGER